MKKNISILSLVLLLSSCSQVFYYQVFESKLKGATEKTESLVYENEDLQVNYDLWGKMGYMYARVYNKKDVPVYIDLDRSHLIINGNTVDYYQPDEQTIGKQLIQKTISNFTNTQTNVVRDVSKTTKMKKVIEIPPDAYAIIGNICMDFPFYKGCGLSRFPNSKFGSFVSFNPENTPYNFRNYMTYSLSYDFNKTIVLDNNFWVEKITNINQKRFLGDYKAIIECDKRTGAGTYSYPFKKAGNFYIEYKAKKQEEEPE
jgi:hypothetical protein